jgi:hypothetical protein
MYIVLKSPVIISLNSLSATQKLLQQAALCQFAINQDKKNQLPCQTAQRLRPSRSVRSFFATFTAEGQDSPCPASSLGFLHANSLI